MTILDKIVDRKKEIVKDLYKSTGLQVLKENCENTARPASRFKDHLSKPGLSLIAEIKKASPSKGIIREKFDVHEIAEGFIHNGASAFSILTDADFFMGKNEYLSNVNKFFKLPILRKDFIVDEIQVYESKVIGADAILLILAILTVEEAQKFIKTAKDLEMDVLIEIHSDEDAAKLKQLNGVEIIGVNNRNLNDFSVDIQRAIRYKNTLKHDFPSALFVAESGYQQANELENLEKNSFNAVLIGEGLALSEELITYFKQ